ncbi:putative transposase [Paraburkholderia sp. BL21I4N1]|nr:putative transposase [Paraburkholderia sp. BL21I4N1]
MVYGLQLDRALVLHTWGSALTHHPHVHGIVLGGGLSPDRSRWLACKPGFFLPVRVLSRLFRRRFLEELEAIYRRGQLRFFGESAELNDMAAFAEWLAPMRACEWVVYAKRPFAGPKALLAYLSRYTHRVAISNQRLVALDEHGVTLHWKDYRVDGRTRNRTMTLEADEFARRFLLHVLPGGFHRIRHYGLIANPSRRENLATIRELLDVVPASHDVSANGVTTVAVPPTFVCRHCGSPMIVIDILQRSRPIRAPPVERAHA